jgi:hypothetical protein
MVRAARRWWRGENANHAFCGRRKTGNPAKSTASRLGSKIRKAKNCKTKQAIVVTGRKTTTNGMIEAKSEDLAKHDSVPFRPVFAPELHTSRQPIFSSRLFRSPASSSSILRMPSISSRVPPARLDCARTRRSVHRDSPRESRSKSGAAPQLYERAMRARSSQATAPNRWSRMNLRGRGRLQGFHAAAFHDPEAHGRMSWRSSLDANQRTDELWSIGRKIILRTRASIEGRAAISRRSPHRLPPTPQFLPRSYF